MEEVWCCIRNRTWRERNEILAHLAEMGLESTIVPYKCLRLCMFCANLYTFYFRERPVIGRTQEELFRKVAERCNMDDGHPRTDYLLGGATHET